MLNQHKFSSVFLQILFQILVITVQIKFSYGIVRKSSFHMGLFEKAHFLEYCQLFYKFEATFFAISFLYKLLQKSFGNTVKHPYLITAWKVSKYGVFSGPYFPTFGLNTKRYFVSLRIFTPNAGKYGPE